MHSSQTNIGVLLINLGTPSAPNRRAIKNYLIEFLLDPRVIDLSWVKRQILVRGAIIPLRIKQVLKSYQAIWNETGSPLLIHSQNAAHLLQEKLGTNFHVSLAMRYQMPSISHEIKKLISFNLQQLIILPLFPQYASATTGSIFEKVFCELKHYPTLPKITLINQFYKHPSLIQAFNAVSSPYQVENYDHVLFSFHGLPERHLQKAGTQGFCLQQGCCEQACQENQNCYAAQCHQTAYAIAESRAITNYSICFQSRLGKEPWIQPFTADKIQRLAKQGAKRLLIFCPAFVADCLETLYEIGVEYQELFQHAGGKTLDLVPSLNSHPVWIDALETLVKEQVI